MPKPAWTGFGEAVELIGRRLALEGIPAQPLSAITLQQYRRGDFVAGWEIEVSFVDKDRKLRLLIPKDAPWVGPRVALVEAKAMEWPHVEYDGLLCLRPNYWTINPGLPAEVALEELAMAACLVEELVEKGVGVAFEEEFVSYWHLKCIDRSTPIFSIAETGPPSRKLSVWHGRSFSIVGDTPEAICRWLRNRFSDSNESQWKIENVALMWLDIPPIPNAFPTSASKLLELASSNAINLHDIVAPGGVYNDSQSLVVLGAKTPTGAGLIGVSIYPNRSKYHSRPIHSGFREGKLPAKIMDKKVLGGQFIPRTVERADPSWVHGRDQDTRQQALRGASVAVLGCGSVGGQVADLLASAGVGNLLLIDPETLTWANVGRHILGAEFVGKSKAESLNYQIGRRFPHIKQIDSESKTWQDVMRASPEKLNNHSLIISTVGDWSSESQLNFWCLQQSSSTPVLYGWTEAHCCAGHAVAICARRGCLQCGFSPDGIPAFKVCDWPVGQTVRREPACGAAFQPYGPVELSHVCALIAEFALDCLLVPPQESMHRIWAGSESLLSATCGKWSDSWKQTVGDTSLGSRQMHLPWSQALNCPLCGAH